MIAELKPCSAMKDSGVEWLGEVPEHWAVKRTKSVLSRNESGVWGEDPNNNGVIVLRSTEQTVSGEWNITAPARRRLTSSEYAACRLREGDLVVTKSSGSPRHIGKTSIVTRDVEALECCFSNFMQRLRVKQNTAPRFVWYAFNGELGRRQLDYFSDTTTGLANLNSEIIGRVVLPSPPLSEQAAIVRYLDHADRRIRRYIRAKQKLITLLEEQKQALIHQIVTRGLDPNVRLKPSGVEWLGDVPEHWNLVPLKWASHRSQNGVTPPTSESRFYEDGEIPWYGPSSCGTKEEIGAPVRHLNPITFSEGAARLVRGPAILIVVIGATAGRMALMSDDGSTNQQITAFEFSRDLVSPVFLLRQLRSAESWLRATASTATIPILDSGVVARLPCAMPPMEEQGVINRDLDSHVSRIDPVIVRYLTEIALLREYRTRLIADVVTGKVDVREAAAGLPESDPLADEFDAPTQAAETGVMELEDATESPEELAMGNEVTI